MDHEVPLSEGGPDTDENTRNLCDDCNAIAIAEQFGHVAKRGTDADGWPVVE